MDGGGGSLGPQPCTSRDFVVRAYLVSAVRSYLGTSSSNSIIGVINHYSVVDESLG